VDSPRGVAKSDKTMVGFTVRQWLDMMSPSNVALQPLSIEGTTGLNIAAGIGELTLRGPRA
jgi:poly(3-hydroxyalkanoate) synthetase